MTRTALTAALAAALAAALLLPAAAFAGTQRLAPVGEKNGAMVLLDVASKRPDGPAVLADGLIIFPQMPVTQPGPDHARIVLAFDCKARTIKLTKMTFLDPGNTVLKEDNLTQDPQPAVDMTDGRMLSYACGESFPAAEKTFATESAALEQARAPH